MKPSDTFLTKKDSVNIFDIYLENTNKILHYALIALLPFGKIIIFKRRKFRCIAENVESS